MTKKELQALRVLIDRKRREQLGLLQTADEWWHGTETGYSFKRCRCSGCRYAASQARNRRRLAQLEREPEYFRAKDRARMQAFRDRRRLKKKEYKKMREINNRASRKYRERKRAERNAQATV